MGQHMPRNFQTDAAESNKALQDSLEQGEPRIVAAYGLVGAILLFGAIGYGLDRWMDSSPWFLLIGLFIGIVFGFYDLISTVRRS
jgi:F0F1-type ATP synthase assembly protein I